MLSASDPVRFTMDHGLNAANPRKKRSISLRKRIKHNILANEIIRTRRSSVRDCHFEEMEVNFKDIGYTWVINPIVYAAGKCVGECSVPLQGQNFTRHAVIQTMMNGNFPQTHQKPCCVPIKLGPISILYIESNTVTFNFQYEGMKVLECGCR